MATEGAEVASDKVAEVASDNNIAEEQEGEKPQEPETAAAWVVFPKANYCIAEKEKSNITFLSKRSNV